jgi:hypothetical protein
MKQVCVGSPSAKCFNGFAYFDFMAFQVVKRLEGLVFYASTSIELALKPVNKLS